MSPFVIRTALPFGYLLVYGGLFVLGAIGLACIAVGIRRRRTGLASGGVLIACAITAIVWVNLAAERDLDFNPMIPGEGALVGTWHDTDSELQLRSDHTFVCRGPACHDLLGAGTWAREGDFELRFRLQSGDERRRRVIKYRADLRLTTSPDDPDDWDGKLSFGILAPVA